MRNKTLLSLATLALAATLLWSLGPAQASHLDISAEEWETTLDIIDSGSRTQVAVGMRPTATDGYDVLWDVRALFGAGVRGYFHHPGWPNGDFYVRDVKAPALSAQYSFVVSQATTGGTVTVRPDLRFTPTGCDRLDLSMTDGTTSTTVNLRTVGSYTFVHDGNDRTFTIDATLQSFPKPNAPTMKFARPAGPSDRVVIRWEDPRAQPVSVAGYNIYRIAADGSELKLNAAPVSEHIYFDTRPPADLTGVAYEVRAVSFELCESAPGEPFPVVDVHSEGAPPPQTPNLNISSANSNP